MASRIDGVLLLAAADGAGSARLAARGANLAVTAAIAALAAANPGTVGWIPSLEQALQHARGALNASARRDRNALRDYACTLLLAVVTPTEIAGLQVGDGAMVISTEGGIQRFTQPGRGRFAGETVFVTSPQALRQAAVAVTPASGVTALALLTDGLEPVATRLADGEPFAPFFTPLFAFAAGNGTAGPLEALLASERISARTHDDTTLLLAARRSTAGSDDAT
jgi:hypothetical protein